jgi:hypothetical protein
MERIEGVSEIGIDHPKNCRLAFLMLVGKLTALGGHQLLRECKERPSD